MPKTTPTPSSTPTPNITNSSFTFLSSIASSIPSSIPPSIIPLSLIPLAAVSSYFFSKTQPTSTQTAASIHRIVQLDPAYRPAARAGDLDAVRVLVRREIDVAIEAGFLSVNRAREVEREADKLEAEAERRREEVRGRRRRRLGSGSASAERRGLEERMQAVVEGEGSRARRTSLASAQAQKAAEAEGYRPQRSQPLTLGYGTAPARYSAKQAHPPPPPSTPPPARKRQRTSASKSTERRSSSSSHHTPTYSPPLPSPPRGPVQLPAQSPPRPLPRSPARPPPRSLVRPPLQSPARRPARPSARPSAQPPNSPDSPDSPEIPDYPTPPYTEGQEWVPPDSRTVHRWDGERVLKVGTVRGGDDPVREIRYNNRLEPVERRVAVRVGSRWVVRRASEVEEGERKRKGDAVEALRKLARVLDRTKKGGRDEGEEDDDDENEDDDEDDDEDKNGGDNDGDGDSGFDSGSLLGTLATASSSKKNTTRKGTQAMKKGRSENRRPLASTQPATGASGWIKSPSRLDAIAQRWKERFPQNQKAQQATNAPVTDQWTSALEDMDRRRNKRLQREQEANQVSLPAPPPTRSNSQAVNQIRKQNISGRPAQIDAFGNPVPLRHTNTPAPRPTTPVAPPPSSSTLDAIRTSDGRRYTVTMEIDGVSLTTPFAARRGTGQDEGKIVLTPVDTQGQAPSELEAILEPGEGTGSGNRDNWHATGPISAAADQRRNQAPSVVVSPGLPDPQTLTPVKRGPGRPPGSKNKPKTGASTAQDSPSKKSTKGTGGKTAKSASLPPAKKTTIYTGLYPGPAPPPGTLPPIRRVGGSKSASAGIASTAPIAPDPSHPPVKSSSGSLASRIPIPAKSATKKSSSKSAAAGNAASQAAASAPPRKQQSTKRATPSTSNELAGLDEVELDEYVSARQVSPGERDYVPVSGSRRPSVDPGSPDDVQMTPRRSLRKTGRFEGNYFKNDETKRRRR